MEKVYAVVTQWMDGTEVLGLCRTKEEAEHIADSMEEYYNNTLCSMRSYFVDEIPYIDSSIVDGKKYHFIARIDSDGSVGYVTLYDDCLNVKGVRFEPEIDFQLNRSINPENMPVGRFYGEVDYVPGWTMKQHEEKVKEICKANMHLAKEFLEEEKKE